MESETLVPKKARLKPLVPNFTKNLLNKKDKKYGNKNKRDYRSNNRRKK